MYRWIVCLTLIGGCQEFNFSDASFPPVPSIGYDNTANNALTEGVVTHFSGTIDDKNDFDPHDIAWFLDGEQVEPSDDCLDVAEANLHDVFCSIVLGSGEAQIRLRVKDSRGNLGLASRTFTLTDNEPPVAQIQEQGGLEGLLHESLTILGVVADKEDDQEQLTVRWSVTGDPVPIDLTPGSITSDGTASVGAELLEPGTYVLTLEVEDTFGNTGVDTANIEILEGGPSVAFTAPITSAFLDDDSIVFTADLNDPNGDESALSLQWLLDTDPLPEVTVAAATVSLTTDAFAPGSHTLELIATDPDGYSGTDAITFTIDGKPSAPAVSVSPDDPRSTEALMAEVDVDSIDPEGELVAYHYTWFEGVNPTNNLDVELPADETTKGQAWSVEVYATDPAGQRSDAVMSSSVDIGNGLPVIDSVVIDPAAPTSADPLTCTATAHDPDGDTLTGFTYQWFLDTGASLDPLGTGPTLDPSLTAPGDTIVCEAEVGDGEEDAVATQTVDVLDQSAPSLTGVTVAPDPAKTTDDLTATANGWFDAENDDEEAEWRWLRDAVAIAGATASTLPAEEHERDNEIIACATPVNSAAGQTGVEVCSLPLTIENTPPTLASAFIDQGPFVGDPMLGDTLSAGTAGWFDADGDLEDVRVQWQLNGADIPGAILQDLLLDANLYARDDAFTVTVTPWDGLEEGDPVVSEPVTIGNSPPVVISVTFVPSSPRTDDNVTAVIVDDDPDGDAVTIARTWTVDGVDTLETGPTLNSSHFERGDTVEVTVIPSDDFLEGSPFSASVVIVNSAPSCTAHLTPLSPTRATNIDVAFDSWTDADTGDPQEIDDIEWTVTHTDGSADVYHTSGTPLEPSFFERGDVIDASISPSDLIDIGTPCDTGSVEVKNSRPTVGSVDLSPTDPFTEDALTATVNNVGDADGDVPTLHYAWYADDVLIGGAISSTLSPDDTRAAQVIRVEVTPDDEQTTNNLGDAVSSNPATVVNRLPTAPVVAVTQDPGSLSDIVCTITTLSTDGDNDDTLTYVFEWTQDGVPVDTGTFDYVLWPGDTIEANATAPEQVFTCTVSADDSHELGPPSNTATTTVAKPLLLEVTAANTHACALDDAGDVYCWGDDGNNEVRLRPPTEVVFTQISAGQNVTCGVSDAGTLHCWGSTELVILDAVPVPADAGATIFTAVSTGVKVACAISDSPTDNLYCWGDNGTGDVIDLAPSGLFRWVEAGNNFACAEEESAGGALVCWGNNHGTADLIDEQPNDVFVQISTQHKHVCGVLEDASVLCWGANNSQTDDYPTPFTHPATTWEQATAGNAHSCAIDQTGEIFCWGQSGSNRLDSPTGPHAVVTAGASFTCAVDSGLTEVHCWGANGNQQAPELWVHPSHD